MSYTTLPSQPTYKLPSYRDKKGAMAVVAALLIPYATVSFLVWYSVSKGGDMSLDTMIEVSGKLRIALIFHGLYFIGLPYFFEVAPDSLLFPFVPESILSKEENTLGTVPDKVDNLYWMMTGICGDFFFTAATAFLSLAAQTSIPRYTLLVPIVQTVYNVKNDMLWVGFGKSLSPVNKRVTVFFIDWFVITALMILYMVNFFSAPVATA